MSEEGRGWGQKAHLTVQRQSGTLRSVKGSSLPQPIVVKREDVQHKIVIEPDGDRWHACCPALEQYGAATWGNTEGEALKHIQEVVQIVIDELLEDGEPIPEASGKGVQVFSEPQVMVTI